MRTALMTVFGAACVMTAAHSQQPDPLTRFEVRGHVYEPQAVPPTDGRIGKLRLPAGFSVHRFAEGLNNPRMLAVADDGAIYVTQRTPGNLVMLRDVDGDGIVDAQRVVLRIPDLHGIALRDRTLYLTDVNRVYAAELGADGVPGELRIVSEGIPEAGQHPNRTLKFAPDGRLFLSIGSTCNACAETSPEYATLSTVDLAGGKRTIFASGLRNTIGFDWNASGELFGFDHGIDWLGDDAQSEELNHIVEGRRYGWPYVYDDDKLNPQDEPLNVTQLRWAQLSEEPVAGYTAHAAPMQMAFYDAGMFPSEYRGSAFVAMHGSWNRRPPSGYEVIRAKFNSRGDFEGIEPFLSGFLVSQPDTAPPLPGTQPKPPLGFIARPTGIATAQDGSLLVGDDSNNAIYRVAHGTAPRRQTPQRLAIDLLESRLNKSITVRSAAFSSGGTIPARFSDYGEGVSPPLRWSGIPAGTRSIVLMMEDAQATSPLPFVHWITVLPATASTLPEGIRPVEQPRAIPNARQGSNSRSEFGYFGPRPPPGPPHAYRFQVFAVDRELTLPSGFNRHSLIQAMKGHVLAEGQLVGMLGRKP